MRLQGRWQLLMVASGNLSRYGNSGIEVSGLQNGKVL